VADPSDNLRDGAESNIVMPVDTLPRMRRLRRALAAGWAEPFTRWLGVVLIVATVVRVVWVLYAAREPVGIYDPHWYEMLGVRIANGDGYTLPGGDPTAYYSVGYPAALAGAVWFAQHTPLSDNVPVAAGLLNSAFAVATVALIGMIGRRLAGWRVGIGAAALAALFPSQIFYTAAILSETLFNFLLVASLAILVWRRSDQLGMHRLLTAGLVLGLAALTRPVALFVVPFAALAWWLAHTGWRTALRRALALGLGIMIVLVPWAIRNWVRMGEPIAIATSTGDNLCIGHNPEATGAFQLTEPCLVGVPNRVTTEEELERDETLRTRAVDYFLDHPQREIPLLWWRGFYTYRTDDDGLDAVESYGDDEFIGSRMRDVLATVANAFYFGVLALAAVGAVALWSRARAGRMLYFAWLAAMAASPLAFFGDPRFKVPFALLCVVPAAVTMAALPAIRRTRLEPDRADISPVD